MRRAQRNAADKAASGVALMRAIPLSRGMAIFWFSAVAMSATTQSLADASSPPDWSGTWSLSRHSRDSVSAGGGLRKALTAKYAAMMPAGPRDDTRGAAPPQGPPAAPPPGASWHANLAKCALPGMPGSLLHPYAHEYLFSPGRVTMLIESGEVRRIYTDGRPHPRAAELYQTLVGHSIGHWEGDTLVVDTIGMRSEAEISIAGLHVTRRTHLVERIHRKDANTMQIDTTVTDPDIFSRPYRYTLLFDRVPGELIENDCALDQHDNDESIDLTPPPAPQP